MTNGSPRQVRRRENLRKLIEDNGGQAQVALEIGTPKSHLSAILAGRRGVGDALAQKVEAHFDKPAGWLDASTGEDRYLPEIDEIATQITGLPDGLREQVLLAVRIAVDVTLRTVAAQKSPDTDRHIPTQPVRRSGG